MPSAHPGASRAAVVADLAARIAAVRPGERAIVAIDGVDGAGKTVLRGELAPYVRRARPVIEASVDGFHNPRAVRYAAGRGPETFYRDSYNYAALRQYLVSPFRMGSATFTARHDVAADEPRVPKPVFPAEDALLLIDGIFLNRPELRELWDASVWLDVPFDVSVPRGAARDHYMPDADPNSAGNHRYVAGQQLYQREADPRRHATWILDNTDLVHPVLTKTSPQVP